MADTEKDKEHNYVADAQNWEARVKGELDSARVSTATEYIQDLRYNRPSRAAIFLIID